MKIPSLGEDVVIARMKPGCRTLPPKVSRDLHSKTSPFEGGITNPQVREQSLELLITPTSQAPPTPRTLNCTPKP